MRLRNIRRNDRVNALPLQGKTKLDRNLQQLHNQGREEGSEALEKEQGYLRGLEVTLSQNS